MKKTILFTSFFILLLTTVLFFAIPASAELYGGDCGVDKDSKVSWTFNTETGVLTVEGKNGTGVMAGYSSTIPTPWDSFKNDIKSVVVEGNVTTIGNYAFAGCSALQTVNIESTLSSIGWSAFANCTSLETVTFNGSVSSVGTAAFYKCTALKSITLPNSVKSLGDSAFRECIALESFDIPQNLASISPYAFYGCTALKSLGGNPKKLANIGHCAFSGCTALSEPVVIPDGVGYISDGAFRDCESLTSISLPASLYSIGLDTFDGCDNLSSATYRGTIADWNAIQALAQGGNSALFDVLVDATGASMKAMGDVTYYETEEGRIPAEEREGVIVIIVILFAVACFAIYLTISRVKAAKKAKKRLHNPTT